MFAFGISSNMQRIQCLKLLYDLRQISKPLSVLIGNSSLLQSKTVLRRSPRFFATPASQDGSTEKSDERPVPRFKNVLQHLQQLSTLVEASPTERADFTSTLEQLAADDALSEQLNEALKAKMELQSDYLIQQNSLRCKENTLSNRTPLPVFSNGAFLFPNLPSEGKQPASFIIEYISAMVLSVLSYRMKLCKDKPEVAKQMFGSCRRPAAQTDTQHFADEQSSTLSLIISRQSNFFHLELDEKMPEGEAFFVLKRVVEFILSYKNAGTVPFGSLSTLPRTDATFGYQFLNETALERLQMTQFIVNLDHLIDAEDHHNLLAKHILIGDPENVGNRWFDKALQLILVLNRDGSAILGSGICFEKSLVTEDSVVDLMHHAVEYLTKFKPIEIQPEIQATSDEQNNQLMIKLQKLDLVKAGQRDVLTSATNDFAFKKYVHLTRSFQLNRFTFRKYGSTFINSINCHPDAWAHAAVGLAFRNFLKLCESPKTYQAYKGITSEMMDYFEDSLDEGKLRLALESWLFTQQLSERGYDIENILRVYEKLIDTGGHLSQKSLFLKSLFRHDILSKLNHPLISISRPIPMVQNQQSTANLGIVEARGPLVSEGFACAYQFLGNDSIDWTISSCSKEDTSKEFSQYLNHALLQMKSVIAF